MTSFEIAHFGKTVWLVIMLGDVIRYMKEDVTYEARPWLTIQCSFVLGVCLKNRANVKQEKFYEVSIETAFHTGLERSDMRKLIIYI